MANVLHSTLTGADLHESKGAANAVAGQVAVATGSGTAVFGYLNYTQIAGTPTLAPVAISGAYADLTGKPVLATVATSGAYADLTGKPVLAAVATSGSYVDLTNKPVIPAVYSEGTLLTTTPLIKTYTVAAVGGLWSFSMTGFTTIRGVQATAVNVGGTVGATAVASVTAASTTGVTGNVALLTNPPVLGTTQTVYVTVMGT